MPEFDLEAIRVAQAAARAQAAVDLDDTEQPAAHLAPAAIAACQLCGHEGCRGDGGTICDHIDHRGAARRGMAKIRAARRKATTSDLRSEIPGPLPNCDNRIDFGDTATYVDDELVLRRMRHRTPTRRRP